MRCLPNLCLALTVCAAGALAACTVPRDSETPGIPLGAPGISWAAKNTEQRFGFMASQVHPRMQKLFREYKPDSYADFSCSNCHGATMEQIDYAMPNQSLYALPKDKPFDDAIDFDSQIAVFMMTKVTPTLQELFNQGEGPRTKVTCFNCHPGT
ncbi:MAG TPA: hypothetical protein VFS67_03485 [Polyangiaceae bacterium]|jgi:hypothetical protein|nr:hypothetical protein [Polyangiaceae bacterium]